MARRGHALRPALLAAVLLAACARERPGLAPRHVVVVTVSGLRADACSFLTDDRTSTWVASDDLQRLQGRAFGLDDLAAEGVVFARAFAPSPVTEVSLATLMTGRPPLEHGVTAAGERLSGQVVTWAECLRAAGFRTAAFLAGAPAPDPSLAQGFASVERFERDGAALRAAVEWLGEDPGDGSGLCAWIHLAALDLPWDGREMEAPAKDLLAGRTFAEPGYVGPADGSARFVADVRAGRFQATPRDRAALERAYEREVAALTATLWAGLAAAFDFHGGSAESSETWARTLLVVAGASGFELLETGGVGRAGSLHESVLRVPLVLRHPDSLTGARILDAPVELADVMPTLLEWFDLPHAPGVRGRSLLALTDARPARAFERRPAFAELRERVFSARTERWHLVWNPLGAKPEGRAAGAPPIPVRALYEPEVDPRERDDVSGRHPEVAAELEAAIRRWREAQVPFPAERRPPPAR